MADHIINEVLWILNSHYGTVPNDTIITVISSFYTEEELVTAKKTVYEVCEKFVKDE